jgi:XTP/dITP diphosphohydrolase
MTKSIVFATNNEHKLKEIQEILNEKVSVFSLKDIDCFDEIPEDHDTLEDNALQKARYIYDKFGVSCFADDTGLEVEALGGNPGVYSARYAGEAKSSEENVKKLLHNLQNVDNKTAQFRTVIAFINNGEEHIFEGIVKGNIINENRGANGFGYDPVFIPEGYTKTFAELSSDEKNKISHRAIAINKLVQFLNSTEK